MTSSDMTPEGAVELRQDRPAEIAWATELLCLSLAVGVVKVIVAWRVIGSTGDDAIDFPFILTALIFVLNALLIRKIWQGRNWARVTLLVMFALGVLNTAASLVPQPGLHVSLLSAILQIVQLAIYAYALLLIYGPKGKRWFQPMES
jgi:uncharacterized protein involved in response to NO